MVALVVWQSRAASPTLLVGEGMDDLDASYLAAETKGQGGGELLKRLQEIWFVGAHKDGLGGISAHANSIATELMSAEVRDA